MATTTTGPRSASRRPSPEPTHYLDFLRELHVRLRPATYLEVGVRNGDSLACARPATRCVGIDPEFAIRAPLDATVRLERTTSDEYFARPDACAWLGRPVEMAFIDGMHLFEYALRDFINVEKHCDWASVIVFDDMFPRNVDEAARERHTKAWTGDVFRMQHVLRTYRPDLRILVADTQPTGLLLVTGLDPTSTVLDDAYDEIVAREVHEDPQDVPRSVLDREGALDPSAVLRSPLWGCLHRGHWPLHPRAHGIDEIDETLEHPDAYRHLRRAARARVQREARVLRRRVHR